jgi:hypothetical protein
MHGNIYVKNGNSGVYLYTSKQGQRLPQLLKSALVRGTGRWGDTKTLTSIIYQELIQSKMLELNGTGISSQLEDNDQYILVVDDVKELVGAFLEDGTLKGKWTFSEFISKNGKDLEWNSLVRRPYRNESLNLNHLAANYEL